MAATNRMAYHYLGNSGLKVSNLCMGTRTFGKRPGGPKQCSVEEAHGLLDRFVDAGGNFIDTANSYSFGEAEEVLGNWMVKQKREKLVIATKVFARMDEDPNSIGLSRAHIMNQVDESLRRLQTNYIDLYQAHVFDCGTPVEETFSAFNDLVQMGKVRYIGVSNFTGWQLQKVVDLVKYNRWAPIVSLQQQWSLITRDTEYEQVDVCHNEGIGILPWSPLKGGLLSGKYKRDSKNFEEGSRIAWATEDPTRAYQSHPNYDEYDTNETWNLMEILGRIAKEQEKSVAQVSLRWLLQKEVVPSVIIGAKTMAQLEDNLGAATGWELTTEQLNQLDEASKLRPLYPQNMIARLNKSRMRTNKNK